MVGMGNIIHIRGTSGSGKSHLARRIFDLYTVREDSFVEGRKRPIGSTFTNGDGRDLYAVGHYETDCGGADTVPNMDLIHELVANRYMAPFQQNVLFEGLLSTPEFNRTVKLHKMAGNDLHVIFLTTDLETCVSSVNGRRAAKAARTGKGAPPPLNPKNTESKFKSCRTAAKKLRDAGVQVYELDREAAFVKVRGLLGV